MEDSCCVGKIAESECNLKHYSSITETIPLCDLTTQHVIQLRVKSKDISFIGLLCWIWKKSRCCDPYSKHGNKSVKCDKTITLEFCDKIFCATNSLPLIPGEKICPRCNKLQNEVIERGTVTPEKMRPQLSHENNGKMNSYSIVQQQSAIRRHS
uniref:Cc8L18.2-like protein n=1 Tax=Daphnia magna TaxID=35525 RepID=A0A0P4X653_9CRUS